MIPKLNDYQVNYPFINKYRHAHSKIENTDDNWPVYRYADCLLLLAECLVEQGRAGDAAPYVNQVRARAGLPAVTTINAEVVPMSDVTNSHLRTIVGMIY